MSNEVPRIVREPISLANVRRLAEAGFGDMVKACVDIGRGLMAIGGELHSDEAALLLDDGSTWLDRVRFHDQCPTWSGKPVAQCR